MTMTYLLEVRPDLLESSNAQRLPSQQGFFELSDMGYHQGSSNDVTMYYQLQELLDGYKLSGPRLNFMKLPDV